MPWELNLTEMLQLAPAASELEHELVCAKLPGFVPEKPMLLMSNSVVPVFLSVTVCDALLFPGFTDPKFRLAGLSVARE